MHQQLSQRTGAEQHVHTWWTQRSRESTLLRDTLWNPRRASGRVHLHPSGSCQHHTSAQAPGDVLPSSTQLTLQPTTLWGVTQYEGYPRGSSGCARPGPMWQQQREYISRLKVRISALKCCIDPQLCIICFNSEFVLWRLYKFPYYVSAGEADGTLLQEKKQTQTCCPDENYGKQIPDQNELETDRDNRADLAVEINQGIDAVHQSETCSHSGRYWKQRPSVSRRLSSSHVKQESPVQTQVNYTSGSGITIHFGGKSGTS